MIASLSWLGGPPSLFRRLLVGFAGVMLAAWLGVLAWTLAEIHADQSLFARAQLKTAAGQAMAALRLAPPQTLPIQAWAKQTQRLQLEMHGSMGVLLAPYQLQVWHDHVLLVSPPRLPTAEPTPADAGRLLPLPVAGQAWFSWTERDANTRITVRVSQESLFGFAMGWRSLTFYLLPLLVSLPFMLLPTLFIIRRGLRPLTSVVTELEERSAADLTALTSSSYKELMPLTTSVNRLMQRLKARLDREHEFLHDAAHELKTPLAVIQINADALMQAHSAARQHEAREGLAQGLSRATRTVQQLLSLARTGSEPDTTPMHITDLAQLLRERLGAAAPLALTRRVDLELAAPETCLARLHPESAAALIENLIDNAIKYSPDGACVKVALQRQGQTLQLTVTDQGPGIPAAWRAQVFERFFRVPDQTQTGSGLGLAIVERAAARHGAQVVLQDARDAPERSGASTGAGLSVSVAFQALDHST